MFKKRMILWIVFLFALAGSAYEMRVWKDADGNEYKGRFVRELFGKLTIETEDGGEEIFNLEHLSELDQKYLRVMVPPKMEVRVSSKTVSIEPRPVMWVKPPIIDDHQVTVRITKKSQRPFTSRLKAEIFMVADEVDGPNSILLGRTEREFLMPTVSKGAEIELKSQVVRTMQFREGVSGTMKGEDYKGYLLVISTLQGEMVLVDSTLPSWIEDPQVIENLRELSIVGAPSVRSRHFDKIGKKVQPQRPPQRSPRAT